MPRKSDHKLTIAGLTGSIGSGKTTAANYFKELGAVIIDADLLAREVVKPGSQALEKIKRLFGPAVMKPTGGLNRNALAEVVFNNPSQRKALEEIVHPQVHILFKSTLQRIMASQQDEPLLIVYVVPLLFESGWVCPELDLVIVVSAQCELCVKRVVERDGCTPQIARAKYASQLPVEQKEALADYVIVNDGNLETLRDSVETLFDRLMGLQH